jgi:CspA family cold shock protein
METGTISKLTENGYGFITREGQDKDLFFHSNELQGVDFDSLKEGDTLQFEVTEGPKGPQASNVSKA